MSDKYIAETELKLFKKIVALSFPSEEEKLLISSLFEEPDEINEVNKYLLFCYQWYVFNFSFFFWKNDNIEPRFNFHLAIKDQLDLVIRTNNDKLFQIDYLIMTSSKMVSIKPEFRFLFRNISRLSLTRFLETSSDQIARQARIFQEIQIE